MTEFLVFEFPAEHIGHLKAIGHRDVLNLRILLSDTGNSLSPVILHGLLADGQHHTILSFHGRFHSLEHIGIVAAGQSAVSCHDHIAVFFRSCFLHIHGCKIRIAVCDILQSLVKLPEIRTAGFCSFLCFTQFGGCYKFHRPGDLHGALHTSDTQLHRFHICSHMLPPLSLIFQALYSETAPYTHPGPLSASARYQPPAYL